MNKYYENNNFDNYITLSDIYYPKDRYNSTDYNTQRLINTDYYQTKNTKVKAKTYIYVRRAD